MQEVHFGYYVTLYLLDLMVRCGGQQVDLGLRLQRRPNQIVH